MSFYGKVDPNLGFSGSHMWFKTESQIGFWYVLGTSSFTSCGYAVVDDFGTLVEVTV